MGAKAASEARKPLRHSFGSTSQERGGAGVGTIVSGFRFRRAPGTISAEDMIIAKLEWAKLSEPSRQIDDAAGILRVAGSTLQRGYLDRWVDELGLAAEWDAALRVSRG